MKSPLVSVACVGAWLLGLGVVLFAEPQNAPSSSLAFKPQGLVAVSADSVLAWDASGRVQIAPIGRSPGRVIELPLSHVAAAAADPRGALLAGVIEPPRAESRHGLVVLVNPEGRVIEQWTAPSRFISVTSGAGKAWALTLDDANELLAGGLVRRETSISSFAHVITSEFGRVILCSLRILSEAQSSPARCESIVPAAWSAQGAWVTAPAGCGTWLVEAAVAAVSVQSLEDGRQVVSRSSAATTGLVCGPDDTVVVLGSRIAVLSLPDLRPVLTTSCGGQRPLAAGTVARRIACVNGLNRLSWIAMPSD